MREKERGREEEMTKEEGQEKIKACRRNEIKEEKMEGKLQKRRRNR